MKLYKLFLAVGITLFSACSDDFLNVNPTGYATQDQLDNLPPSLRDSLSTPLVSGLYSKYALSSASGGQWYHTDYGITGIFQLSDVQSNDMALEIPSFFQFDHVFTYRSSNLVRPMGYWSFFYTIINQANSILRTIPQNISVATLKANRGQALVFRALSYSYLIQMYQKTYKGNEDAPGVPLILTTAEGGLRMNRVPVREIYQQIESDYLEGIECLKGWKRNNKSQIDENVACGLLARTYLVMNRWSDAAQMANRARSNSENRLMTQSELLKDKFNDIENVEWMWGYDVITETSLGTASFSSWICSFDEGYGGAVGAYRKIDKSLFEKIGKKDRRRWQFTWPGSREVVQYSKSKAILPEYTNKKFKAKSNWLADNVYMRVSEMLLIEAEAYAQMGNTQKAAIILKELMTNRDSDWNQTEASVEDVYTQRRIELWGEGFAFFDLMRLKKGIDRTYAGSNYYEAARIKIPAGDWQFVYQIPKAEIEENDDISLADQNP